MKITRSLGRMVRRNVEMRKWDIFINEDAPGIIEHRGVLVGERTKVIPAVKVGKPDKMGERPEISLKNLTDYLDSIHGEGERWMPLVKRSRGRLSIIIRPASL